MADNLKEISTRYRSFFEYHPDAGYFLDLRGRFTDCNMACTSLLGYRADDLLGRVFTGLVEPVDREQVVAHLQQTAQQEAQSLDIHVRRINGRLVHLTVTSIPIFDNDQVIGWHGILRPMAGTGQMDDALRESENRMRMITDHLPALIGYTDAKERFRFVNRTYQDWFGIPQAAMIAKTVREVLGEEEYTQAKPHVQQVLSGHKVVYERQMASERGHRYVQAAYLPDSAEDRQVKGFYILVTDVTERKHLEAHLAGMAQHDALTGLPNRRLLYEQLKQAMGRARWHHLSLGLMFLDLNDFKKVNDNYGHAVGDLALVAFAQLLKKCMRKKDTVARLAGDEFVVIVEDMETSEDAAAVARKIIREMRRPLIVEGQTIPLSTSIGIAIWDRQKNADDLVDQADKAMYRAKHAGINNYQFAGS